MSLSIGTAAEAWSPMPQMYFDGPSVGPVVEVKKKKRQQQDGAGSQGERSCPAGYVVLDKPNKYGAFCEPKEDLPKTEVAKCKFGMIGTPPHDCHCPGGTTFEGYKGCVKTVQTCCTTYYLNGGKATYCRETEADAREVAEGATYNGQPPEKISCASK